MKCPHCGCEVLDGVKFCVQCGSVMPVPQINQVQVEQRYTEDVPKAPKVNPKTGVPYEYTPITAWGYFGYQLLFCIPMVGFIMLLVFSLGGTRNINLRNYSRSFFCSMLICLIIWLLFFLLFGGLMIGLNSQNSSSIFL